MTTTTSLKHVKIAPKGMGLNDFVAQQEGFFAAEGLDVEFDWKTFRGTQSSWKNFDYFQRPQDKPYTESKEDVKDVPVSVGLRAGSHFNVPYRLEKYLPLEHIKIVNTGGFGARLKALLDGEVEAASLLPPQIAMAEQLGLRPIIRDTFKTLWWVPENSDPEIVNGYLRALDRAEKAMDTNLGKYLPLWKLAVPADFENYRPWDFSKFGRGERFVYQALPLAEFDETLDQVKRWGLDQFLKERSFDTLSYASR